jgi:hypothetical protein
MTTIITRLYPDAATVQAVVTALLGYGHDQDTIDVIVRDGASDLMDRMRAARVSPDAAATYTKHMVGNNNALLVVRAGFNPVGAARNAMKVTGKFQSLDVGLDDENQYVREDADMARSSSVLAGNPLVMSNPHRTPSHAHILGSNPISAPRERRSAIAGGAYMSTKFWPMRLVSANAKEGTSAIRGGKLMLTSLIRSE